MDSKTFYDFFIENINDSHNITDSQKRSVKAATFFDDISEDSIELESIGLQMILTHYNNALDRESVSLVFPSSKKDKKKVKDSIKLIEKTIKILEDEELAIPTPGDSNPGYTNEIAEELKKVLSSLQDRNMMMRKRKPSTKTMLIKFVDNLCAEHNIETGRHTKNFIDKLDED